MLVVKSLSHRPVQNQALLLKGYVNLCSTVYEENSISGQQTCPRTERCWDFKLITAVVCAPGFSFRLPDVCNVNGRRQNPKYDSNSCLCDFRFSWQ